MDGGMSVVHTLWKDQGMEAKVRADLDPDHLSWSWNALEQNPWDVSIPNSPRPFQVIMKMIFFKVEG
jgi:hypothetical protein